MNPNGAAADAKGQAEASNEQLQQRCAELTTERDQLRQQLIELREKYDVVRKSLAFVMGMDKEIDEEALFVPSDKGQSLREFVEELKGELKAKGAL